MPTGNTATDIAAGSPRRNADAAAMRQRPTKASQNQLGCANQFRPDTVTVPSAPRRSIFTFPKLRVVTMGDRSKAAEGDETSPWREPRAHAFAAKAP